MGTAIASGVLRGRVGVPIGFVRVIFGMRNQDAILRPRKPPFLQSNVHVMLFRQHHTDIHLQLI